jgi:hypothetical protein
MAISIFKGVVPVEDWSQLGESVRQSQNRAHDLQLEQSRYNEAQRQKREKEYLDLTNVPPEEMISNELQKMQGDKTQQFVELAGKEYRDSNYKPGLQSKIKMQQARNALVSWQNKIKSNEEQWKQAYSVIRKDKLKGDYDDVEFWNKTHDFYKSGELPEDLLMPKKYDSLEGYFVKAGKDLTGTKQEWANSVDKNGKTTTDKITRVATEEERKAQMTDLIHEDIRLNATVVDQFGKLPYDEKKKYLDKYPEKDQGKAIKDFVWDKYNEFYQKNMVSNSVKPTASPFKLASQNDVQVTQSAEGDELPLNMGIYPHDPSKPYYEKNMAGKKQIAYVKYEGEGYSFSPKTVGTIHPSQEYNGKTGKIIKSKPGSEITLSNITIKYVPTSMSGDMQYHRTDNYTKGKYYLNKDGSVKDGYQLRAIVLNKKGNPIPFTEEVRDQLKTAFPKNASTIDGIPLTIDHGEQDPDYKEETPKETKTTSLETYIVNGEKYQFPPEQKEMRDKFLKKYPKAKKIK